MDCAAVYGNEAEVGEGLRDGMKEAGIKREEVFVTSKLWNTFHHPDDVEAACKKTLGDLGLEYLDLYLIHWPMAFKRGEGTLFPKNEDGTVKVLMKAVQYTYSFPGLIVKAAAHRFPAPTAVFAVATIAATTCCCCCSCCCC